MESLFAGLGLGWNTVLFAAGGALVIWGAGKFLDGALFIARAAAISKVVVGATVVSLATTFPEFAVSFSAAFLGKPLLAVGNAVGSYLCNIGLVVGLSALVGTIAVTRRIFIRQALFTLGAAVALWAATLGRESVGRPVGILFILGAVGFLVCNWRLSAAGDDPEAEAPKVEKAEWVRQGLWFLVGAASVGAGSILLVQNGAQIARHAGISELIIGLTIVAVGTSLPEITLAVASIAKGHMDMSLGNILGANVLNVFWVVGSSALVIPLPIVEQNRVLDLPFTLLMMIALLVFGWSGRGVGRMKGGVLTGLYGVYLALLAVFFLG
ncbi:MAG: calcium/sodium antiporter [Nitrospinota bacterium]|nr:calcium/sodium antiporter [Nitrospinota bacterium]MDP6482579.1 calcium/sodium antiporter [Nitrospinota bacterium]